MTASLDTVFISTILLILGLFGIILYSKYKFKRNKKAKMQTLSKEKDLVLNNYNKALQIIEIPKNCNNVVPLEPQNIKENKIYKIFYDVWTKNDYLILFPSKINIDLYYMGLKYDNPELDDDYFCPLTFQPISIKIENIISFEKTGEKYYENKISGGGGRGGGSSIKKAITGGIIAGGVGAIINSRNKFEINEITSEFIAHDERMCLLNFQYENIKYNLSFSYDAYDVFKELIPEKDIVVIDKIRRKNVIEKNSFGEISIVQKLKELKELKDDGIITHQEFEKIKKEFLSKI